MAWRDLSEPPIELELRVSVKLPPLIPQPPPSYARFFVEPSDPNTHDDIEFPEADFTFTADVTKAESYELHFGDGIVERDIAPDSAGKAIRRHLYEDPRVHTDDPEVYAAKMKAWRNTDESVEIELLVSVRPPPAPAPSHERFSVEPSDSASRYGVGFPETNFTFSADVSEAVRYELHFEDGVVVKRDIQPGTGGTAVSFPPHRYETPGRYTALIRAWRVTGELIEHQFQVSVQPATVPPKPGIPTWLLVLAAVTILLSTYWGFTAVSTGTDLVTFEATLDPGTVRVIGSTTADDAVSMRVRRDAGRVVISMDKGERQ